MNVINKSMKKLYDNARPTFEIVCSYSDLEYLKPKLDGVNANIEWEFLTDRFNVSFIAPRALNNQTYETWRASIITIEASYFLIEIEEVRDSLLPMCTAIKAIVTTDNLYFQYVQDVLKAVTEG